MFLDKTSRDSDTITSSVYMFHVRGCRNDLVGQVQEKISFCCWLRCWLYFAGLNKCSSRISSPSSTACIADCWRFSRFHRFWMFLCTRERVHQTWQHIDDISERFITLCVGSDMTWSPARQLGSLSRQFASFTFRRVVLLRKRMLEWFHRRTWRLHNMDSWASQCCHKGQLECRGREKKWAIIVTSGGFWDMSLALRMSKRKLVEPASISSCVIDVLDSISVAKPTKKPSNDVKLSAPSSLCRPFNSRRKISSQWPDTLPMVCGASILAMPTTL